MARTVIRLLPNTIKDLGEYTPHSGTLRQDFVFRSTTLRPAFRLFPQPYIRPASADDGNLIFHSSCIYRFLHADTTRYLREKKGMVTLLYYHPTSLCFVSTTIINSSSLQEATPPCLLHTSTPIHNAAIKSPIRMEEVRSTDANIS